MGASYEDSTVLAEPLAFETFFETEARTLFRRLCIVTGNSAEAEEVVQDAFLALWERWDRVGRLEDPTGYLYRTAMNVSASGAGVPGSPSVARSRLRRSLHPSGKSMSSRTWSRRSRN
jgi:Sigma-70 region 2